MNGQNIIIHVVQAGMQMFNRMALHVMGRDQALDDDSVAELDLDATNRRLFEEDLVLAALARRLNFARQGVALGPLPFALPSG